MGFVFTLKGLQNFTYSIDIIPRQVLDRALNETRSGSTDSLEASMASLSVGAVPESERDGTGDEDVPGFEVY